MNIVLHYHTLIQPLGVTFNCLFSLRPQMGLQGLLLLSLLISLPNSFPCDSNLYDHIGERSIMEPLSPIGSPGPSQQIRVVNLDTFSPVGGLWSGHRVVNVEDHGATGDGNDDTKEFKRAWKEVCSSRTSAVLLVPGNRRFLLKPVVFSGPCKSHVIVKIRGTVEASANRSDWDGKNLRHWIVFQHIKNLVVQGGGTLDGKGKIWWQNSCKINRTLPCIGAPTALTFYSCSELRVEDLRIKNSQQIHMSIEKCSNVRVSRLTITAPERSPNTDGIHVAGTQNMLISDCVIRTGDDCISIENGSRKLRGMNIVCGPGHGISIGSLGENNSRAAVSNVKMDKIIFEGTTNGVRIKTWQGGRGYAKNIIFQNIYMRNVENPIIVDQNYCDSKNPCPEQKTAVAISRVLYKNIKGVSTTKVSTRFDCSKSAPCHGIVLQDINLVGEDGELTQSLCNNVKPSKIGTVIPQPCV